MKDKKWRIAVWSMALATGIALAAMVGWFLGIDGAIAILAQAGGLITLVGGLYSAANVAQKSVVSKNYIPELGKKCGK